MQYSQGVTSHLSEESGPAYLGLGLDFSGSQKIVNFFFVDLIVAHLNFVCRLQHKHRSNNYIIEVRGSLSITSLSVVPSTRSNSSLANCGTMPSLSPSPMMLSKGEQLLNSK